jgi:type IV secretion system protein VirB6
MHALEMVGALLGTGWMDWLQKPLALFEDTTNIVFFKLVNDFLQHEIDEFGIELLGRTLRWIGLVALSAMTLWIMLQGWRIVTGRSRDSLMALVSDSLRATLIVGIATGMTFGGPRIFEFLSNDVNAAITAVVTGRDTNAYDDIDRSLAYMQVALSSIDSIDVGESEIVSEAKNRNLWFTGIGIAGPAITGGAMLLLNNVAMALFIGLGPMFILCLLFEQTKQLFSKWLFYGIGTMFSLALLSVMVAIALKMVLAVSAAFWVGKFTGASTEGVNSMALQQGGLGLILTALIVTAPPMAAAFFQGMLGAFTPYTAFSSDGGARASRDGRWGGGNSYPPGHGGNPGGVQPMSQGRNGEVAPDGNVNTTTYNQSLGTRVSGVDSTSPQQVVPKRDFKSSEA